MNKEYKEGCFKLYKYLKSRCEKVEFLTIGELTQVSLLINGIDYKYKVHNELIKDYKYIINVFRDEINEIKKESV